MLICRLLRVRNDRQNLQNSVKIFASACLVNASSPLHAMPKFRDSDGGNFKLVIWTRTYPSMKIEGPLFPAYDDVRIQNQCHL